MNQPDWRHGGWGWFLVGVLIVARAMAASADTRDTAIRLYQDPFRPAVRVGTVAAALLDEASGVAASRRRGDILWMHNDSGGGPVLYAVSTDGADIGSVRLADAKNIDWEDLASFQENGAAYLVVGDVGDNLAIRPHCTLYVVKEPEFGVTTGSQPLTVTADWRLDFRYEDGPRDCEAIAVEPRRNRCLLLSKRDRPPRLYALALRPEADGTISTARLVATVTTLPRPVSDYLRGRDQRHLAQPTAMDLTADERQLVVLTRRHAYLYRRAPDEGWAAGLGRAPHTVTLPPIGKSTLSQREGICFDRSGESLYVISESRPSPLYRLDRR